jgi:hypothetical protein
MGHRHRDGRFGSANVFNTPGPTPGSDRAIKQHKAIAMGVADMPSEPTRTKTNQPKTTTGMGYAPGISGMKSGKR